MNDDLISRSALKKAITDATYNFEQIPIRVDKVQEIIDNTPTVLHDNYSMGYQDGVKKALSERPQGKWIPVSERMPEDETEVLFQYRYGQSMMVGYHKFDYTIYPFGYEDENETVWYDSEDNFICGDDEVIAWMSKPEPYQAESEEI